MIESVPFTLEAFHAAVAAHDAARRIAPVPRCVGTKRGVNYGVVYGPNGETWGRVFPATQRAAGTNGQRRQFWTANVEGAAVSLGTRHADRASAVRAIRAFYAFLHGPEGDALGYVRAAPESVSTDLLRGRYVPAVGAVERRALSAAAADFKHTHWNLCGISAARYA